MKYARNNIFDDAQEEAILDLLFRPALGGRATLRSVLSEGDLRTGGWKMPGQGQGRERGTTGPAAGLWMKKPGKGSSVRRRKSPENRKPKGPDSVGRRPDTRRQPRRTENKSVLDVLREDERFSTLVKMLEKTGNLQDDLESDQVTLFAPTNEAFQRLKEMQKTKGESDINLEMILKYHMILDQVEIDDLFDGQLLKTELKEEDLGDHRQYIRVNRVFGVPVLNYYSHVQETVESSNGIVFVVDNVLIPPRNIIDKITMFPFIFSTLSMALMKTGLAGDLKEEQELTLLAPTDQAWKMMHPVDLVFLFSECGQKDLEKILEYHVCKELIYGKDIIEEKECDLETWYGENVCICAIERENQNQPRRLRRGDPRRFSGVQDENPNKYIISVNEGEATIRYTDFVGKNGTIHWINSVLIPSDVILPSMKMPQHERETFVLPF